MFKKILPIASFSPSVRDSLFVALPKFQLLRLDIKKINFLVQFLHIQGSFSSFFHIRASHSPYRASWTIGYHRATAGGMVFEGNIPGTGCHSNNHKTRVPNYYTPPRQILGFIPPT